MDTLRFCGFSGQQHLATCSASSCRYASAMASKAYFVEQYAPFRRLRISGTMMKDECAETVAHPEASPAMDDTNNTRPRASRISGRNVFVTRAAPSTLTFAN